MCAEKPRGSCKQKNVLSYTLFFALLACSEVLWFAGLLSFNLPRRDCADASFAIRELQFFLVIARLIAFRMRGVRLFIERGSRNLFDWVDAACTNIQNPSESY